MISNRFGQEGEGSIISYNWSELGSGSGYVTFYGGKAEDNNGDDEYFLTTTTPRSRSIESTNTGDQITLTRTFEATPFIIPAIVKGKALVTFTWGGDADNVNDSFDFSVYIIHYDGTTETTLGSIVEEFRYISGAGVVNQNETCYLDCSEQKFEIGDSLRLKIVLRQSVNTGSNDHVLVLGHDPTNRDGTYITPSSEDATTILRLDCPFKRTDL